LVTQLSIGFQAALSPPIDKQVADVVTAGHDASFEVSFDCLQGWWRHLNRQQKAPHLGTFEKISIYKFMITFITLNRKKWSSVSQVFIGSQAALSPPIDKRVADVVTAGHDAWFEVPYD